MSSHTAAGRIAIIAALLITAAGCVPAPADIGVDYSGPIFRKPGTDAPRLSSSGLPPPSAESEAECSPVIEIPTRKRSDCGVKRTMMRYNTGLQTLYQHRLIEDSTLAGRVVLRMIIAPDGSVQGCDIASTDIHDNELTRQIIAYMRTVSFGALEGVPSWSDTYTLEFSPPEGTRK